MVRCCCVCCVRSRCVVVRWRPPDPSTNATIDRLTRPNTSTIGENVYRFQYFPPNFDFRTKFEYNNWMVASAGLVAATVAGTTWEDLLQTRILTPLGMTNTYTNVSKAIATGNYAIPVTYDATGKVVALDPAVNELLYPIAPAGILAYVPIVMWVDVRNEQRHARASASISVSFTHSLSLSLPPLSPCLRLASSPSCMPRLCCCAAGRRRVTWRSG